MSLRADGKYRCDRCDVELENGGVHEAAVISDVVPGTEMTITRILHLCRVNGCVDRVLTKRAIPAWLAAQEGKDQA